MEIAKLFLDANIILDFFDNRPFELAQTTKIFKAALTHRVHLYISESVVTNVIYLSRTKDLKTALESLLQLIVILPNSNTIISAALASPFKDKEDAVLYHLAAAHKTDGFVTRNKKDFERFALPQTAVLTPTETITRWRL